MQRDQGIQVDSDITTPLLGRKDPFNTENNSANDCKAASDWPGQTDFDGLPWYKTPSVCKMYSTLDQR